MKPAACEGRARRASLNFPRVLAAESEGQALGAGGCVRAAGCWCCCSTRANECMRLADKHAASVRALPGARCRESVQVEDAHALVSSPSLARIFAFYVASLPLSRCPLECMIHTLENRFQRKASAGGGESDKVASEVYMVQFPTDTPDKVLSLHGAPPSTGCPGAVAEQGGSSHCSESCGPARPQRARERASGRAGEHARARAHAHAHAGVHGSAAGR